MNSILEELIAVIVKRVSEQVLAELDARPKPLNQSAGLSEEEIVRIVESKRGDIDSRIDSLERSLDELGALKDDLRAVVREEIREMDFEVTVR